MLDDTKECEQHFAAAKFQAHLVELERFAADQGLGLVAHLLGCARMVLEQDFTAVGHVSADIH